MKQQLAAALFVAASTSSILCITHGAFAGENEATCVAAFEDAQRFRTAQKLRAAREALVTCARPVCPKIIADRCKKWKDTVEAATPAVTVRVVDDQGATVTGATVTIDGSPMTIPDNGIVDLDPGPHGARAEQKGSKPSEARFQLDPGDRGKTITLKLERDAPLPVPSASAAPVEDAPHGGIPTISYVLGGVGLASVGVFAYLGLSGKSRENQLETTCSPRCAPEDVSSLRTKYIAADILLGVGVVTLGVATWLAIRGEPAEAAAKTSVDVGPSGVSLRGAF